MSYILELIIFFSKQKESFSYSEFSLHFSEKQILDWKKKHSLRNGLTKAA